MDINFITKNKGINQMYTASLTKNKIIKELLESDNGSVYVQYKFSCMGTIKTNIDDHENSFYFKGPWIKDEWTLVKYESKAKMLKILKELSRL